MKAKFLILIILLIPVIGLFVLEKSQKQNREIITAPVKSHWFLLHRKSSEEFLYYGIMGDVNNSKIVRKFQVKPGIAGQSPTPLPSLAGRDYWLIVKKESSIDNPETAPYFLTLDIPATGDWPYGPVPYTECTDPLTGEFIQCDWILPGYFGLHGTGGNSLKLTKEDLGSSGCVRHSDGDITYLFNLLKPDEEEIRYYIEDI
ncbi:MAG: hypothetical protein ACD_37C00151G0001 [uncultured bacterium]|nr:MAG: hypothetical protein ACD_37C00151G0001 [uncultured bacterium]